MPRTGLAALAFCLIAVASAPASAAPAWWRVSDGRASVWIIGAPRITPKDMQWDESGLTQRLTGASQLVIAVQPRDGLKALAVVMSGAGSGAALDQSLPLALRRRFDALSTAIGQDPRRYANWKPAVAGVMLTGDAYKAWNLRSGGVESGVRKVARKMGVRETPAGTFDVADMASAAANLSPPGQATCLNATLAALEVGPERLRAAAADWMAGDPRPASQLSGDDGACLAAMPGMKAMNDQNLAADAAAVAAALNAPGRSVAVFDLQVLTMPGGVLDRLRQRGLSVAGPMAP